MTTQMNAQKNITVDDVKENIQRFNFKHWVSQDVLKGDRDAVMMNGREIYQRIFNPALFDLCGQKRYEFFEAIGYIELMNVLRTQDIARDDRSKISDDLFDLIKKRIEPLWIGNFDYPSPVISVDLGRGAQRAQSRSFFRGWRAQSRRQFRKELKERNLSFEEASEIIYKSTGKRNFALVKDISLKHIATAAENRKQRLHEQRTDVSRVMMRADLPSDLVPLVCAYAVPESKTYDYM